MILSDEEKEEIRELWLSTKHGAVAKAEQLIAIEMVEAKILKKQKAMEPVGYFSPEYMGGPIIYSQVNYSSKDQHGVIPLFEHPSPSIPDGWISVEDRLPSVGMPVLVAREGKESATKTCHDGMDWLLESIHFPVTHWMPLPDVPKVKP